MFINTVHRVIHSYQFNSSIVATLKKRNLILRWSL